MKIEKQQVAGYGLHYHANNQLIQNPIDRVLFQCLIDLVRRQLATSLDNQTIILSKRQLSRISGLERSRTLPASIKRLEELGLIKKYKNGILVCCDEYVALVQLYESLSESEKDELAEKFTTQGITILQEYGSCVNTHKNCVYPHNFAIQMIKVVRILTIQKQAIVVSIFTIWQNQLRKL